MSLSPEQNRFTEKLYKENFGLLMRLASRVLEDGKIAEEIVQDTFVEAVRKIDVLCSHEKPEAWLVAVLKYKLYSYRRTRMRETLAMEKLLSKAEAASGEQSSVGDGIDFSDAVKDIIGDESFRMLYCLYILGCSYAETAERFGVTIDVCKKQVTKAKKLLRENSENFL